MQRYERPAYRNAIEQSPPSSNSGSVGYYDDGGDSLRGAYRFHAQSERDHEDSGFSEQENFNPKYKGPTPSYLQAKTRLNNSNRYETIDDFENRESRLRSSSSSRSRSKPEYFSDYDVPRQFPPRPSPRYSLPLLDSSQVPPTPPLRPPKARPRAKSLDNLDFRGVPIPTIRSQVIDSPRTPHRIRHEKPRVAQVVEAINRSRSPSPSHYPEDGNWRMQAKRSVPDIIPQDTSFRPVPAARKTVRQELDIDEVDQRIPVPPVGRNRRHSFDARSVDPGIDRADSFQRRKSEDQHLYEHLHLRPASLVSKDTEPRLQSVEDQYEKLPPRRVQQWIEHNIPDTIPNIDEPEELAVPSNYEAINNYRKSSTAGTGISGISARSANSSTSYHGLTVAPEVEDGNENKIEQDKCHNFYIIVIKWFAAILVALIVLGCVLFNKLCLLAIGRAYSISGSTNSTGTNDSNKNGHKESIVIMLIIILMVPQAFSLLVAIWDKKRSQPWPSKNAVLLIVLGGIIEALCLSFLCIYAITVLSSTPHVFLLFMSGLFVIPTIIQVYESARNLKTTNGKRRTALFVLAALLQIVGLVILFIMNHINDVYAEVGLPIAIFLLSIAWSPKLRRLQTISSELRVADTPQMSPSRATAIPQDMEANLTMETRISTLSTNQLEEPVKRSAREKAALIMSLVQLVVTPLAGLMLSSTFQIADPTKFKEGFRLISSNHPVFYFFLAQIFLTFFGYHAAWLACSMYTQRVAFALPLTLATPLALLLIELKSVCKTSFVPIECGPQSGTDLYHLIGSCALLLLGQFLSTGYYVWANKGYIMGKASHLFWLPSYTGALLEPFLLLNRRNKVTDQSHVTSKSLTRKTYVFICSTMYHEELYEMEQLLESLHDVDNNMARGKRHVESHIFFDDAIKSDVLNNYVLQLATIVKKTLKVELTQARKIRTPYGMQVTWELPGGLPITIHMKDNTKVKNKKRWSQVMYMSYVLDYKQRCLGVNDDQTFILTTDADVNFTHDSMEALIDYMVQDDKVGAVCGRTHPMGNGPLVWYQIFDYAVGHWFMKVANHVFGSVLCCPGCFSLYRCRAVRSVLREYSTNVNEAFEFLTKDMGEDRWFCTLMVQAGWRLAYCAAAEDSTYCPQEFEEFYKQRRRWMPSTLANLTLLVSKWRSVLSNNENISFPFIIYQVILLLATLIGPSIVILFMVGGLVSLNRGAINEEAIVIMFSIVTIAYALVCLFFSQAIQIKVAKLLTFVFAVIMILVTIGLCVQIEKEVSRRKHQNITAETPDVDKLPADVSTLYLGGLVGIFILTALMHPKEAMALVNGFWYLLCLPSGYLLLTIYSVVNMTDRSWGTREAKSGNTAASTGENPLETLWNLFKTKCVCCFKSCQDQTKNEPSSRQKSFNRFSKKFTNRIKSSRVTGRRRRHGSKDFDTESECSEGTSSIYSTKKNKIKKPRKHLPPVMGYDNRPSRRELEDRGRNPMLNRNENFGKPQISITVPDDRPVDYNEDMDSFSETFGALTNQGFEPGYHSPGTILDQETNMPSQCLSNTDINDDNSSSNYYLGAGTTISMDDLLTSEVSLDTPVEEWLKGDLRPYVINFKRHGYDNIAFISGMTLQELEEIGITVRGHKGKLARAIKNLPTKIIEEAIPNDVFEWLDDLDLAQYWPQFLNNIYVEPNDLEELKKLTKENIKAEFKIEKMAHLNMLMRAIKNLKYANQEQKQISQARLALDGLPTETIEPIHEHDEALEYRFWDALRMECLRPELAGFGNLELKGKLSDLRNSVLTIFFVANALWMVVIMVLVKQSKLKALGVDLIGLSFLMVYGAVTVLQFLAMITHRLTTLLHVLARTPWTCCGRKPNHLNFKDNTTISSHNS